MSFKRFIPSLAGRILAITLAFLIIPLSIFSIYLFKKEQKDDREKVLLTMQVLLQSRIKDINAKIFKEQELLHTLNQKMINQDAVKVIMDANATLDGQNEEQIVLLERSNTGAFICTYSPDHNLIGKDLSYLKVVQEAYNEGRQADLISLLNKKPRFVVASSFIDLDATKPSIVLLFVSNPNLFIEDLKFVDIAYPLQLSLVGGNYEITASTFNDLLGTIVPRQYYSPNLPISKVFTFDLNGKQQLALIKSIGSTHMKMMVNVQESILDFYLWKIYGIHLLILFLSIFLIGGLIVFLLSRRATRPLIQLTNVMSAVADGNLQARFKKDPFGFEISKLGLHFNDMLDHLIQSIQKAQKEQLKREEIESELKIASAIQKTLLPITLPKIKKIEIDAHYTSAKEVCGDFYDLHVHKDRLFMVIADGSGKGVSACLVSYTLKSYLRSLGNQNLKLDTLLQRANQLFCEDVKENNMFVTAWLGILNTKTLKLEYASCGHPMAQLKRKGIIEELSTQGIALGVDPNISIEVKSLQLKKQDLLFFYTDGLIEQQNKHGQLFGKGRVALLLEQENGPKEMVHTTLNKWKHFKEGQPQDDDLTLLSLGIK
jgi:HAMP domain-containing protein